jgi:hypothetical protein
MSLAFNIKTVVVVTVVGINGFDLAPGSRWLTGNLLFKAGQPGQQRRDRSPDWAVARDDQGREYLIWPADHPRARGLVIQPIESCYCYELNPVAA